jgi:hypothetical protein
MTKFTLTSKERFFTVQDIDFFVLGGGLYTTGTSSFRTEFDLLKFDKDDEPPFKFLRRIISESDLNATGLEIEITDEDIKNALLVSIEWHSELYREDVEGIIFDNISLQPEKHFKVVQKFCSPENFAKLFLENYVRSYFVEDSSYHRLLAQQIVNDIENNFDDLYTTTVETVINCLLQQVLTPTEVEEEFNLKSGTVSQACSRGAINCRKADMRTWLIHENDAWMEWGQRKLMKESTMNEIYITLKPGNIKNHSIRVTGYEKFFPQDVFGSSNKSGAGTNLRLEVSKLPEPIDTDIDGTKMIFRKRGWCTEFFKAHNLHEGDVIVIEKVNPYLYKVYPKK